MSATIHPFERAKLGLAPFRCVGWFESKYQACPGAPIQPGSSCDYCGQGIMLVFRIKSSDGREFKVGCDCVAKTTRESAKTDAERAASDLQRQVNRFKTAAANARKDEQIKAAMTRLDEHRDVLSGRTIAAKSTVTSNATYQRDVVEYLDWMFSHAGRAGKLRAAKALDAAIAEIEAERARSNDDIVRHQRDGRFQGDAS